ncbi:MAG: acylneuraminate cytidylyltransferase family protein [Muribaculaceae bacterium]|nr:acylneuraminate cytidylyltransferase family protein [Muribaculaceae bacterium]
MKPLYIIPARGGSKSIPKKNIKAFCGKPLIAWSILTALELADPERVIVSTDSDEIADVARRFGISEPHIRPVELATDTASTRDVLLDAMDEAGRRGIDYDCVVLLQPTSPLRTADDIRATLKAWSPEIDMAVTVRPAPCNPYYDCFETTVDGFLRVSKGDGLLTRRQDAPAAWQLNGAVYVISPARLREMEIGRMMRRVPVPMPAERSLDLDTPLDWKIAELANG